MSEMKAPPKVPRIRNVPDPGLKIVGTTAKGENLVDMARECIRDGTFDGYFAKIQAKLVTSALAQNASDTAYYTRAFKSFLIAQGGSYARRPKILDAADMRLPAAAFETFDG
jgi:hypothetical protein